MTDETLEQAKRRQFHDGTLAAALERIAVDQADPLTVSVLFDAAFQIRGAASEMFDMSMDGEVVTKLRHWAKLATGGNCAFADDDAKVLAHLATLAIDAGLHQGVVTDSRTLADMARASASRIEAGTDETLQAAQPEGQEPDPKGDAQ